MTSARWIEEFGVWMCAAADEPRDELRRCGAERHPVTGEAAADEHTVAYTSDVRKRVVREPHRAGPAVRDRCRYSVLVQERLELLLDPVGRALLLADFLVDRAVAPSADENAAVRRLSPVAVAAICVRRAVEYPRRSRRGEHLSSYRPHPRRREMRRVRVGAQDDRARAHDTGRRARLATL